MPAQLIDFMITTHPAYPELSKIAKEKNETVHDVLENKLEELRKEASSESKDETSTGLTKDVHLYPDFHGRYKPEVMVPRKAVFDKINLLSPPRLGNRSPLADSKMRGSISGLNLDNSISDLALKFNVTLEAIALQTRHILDEMNGKGHQIDSIYMSGRSSHLHTWLRQKSY